MLLYRGNKQETRSDLSFSSCTCLKPQFMSYPKGKPKTLGVGRDCI